MRLLFILIALLFPTFALAAGAPPDKLAEVDHIIVFYFENHSFDNLFGHFPGADGIDNAGKAAVQTDENNKPYATLPPVLTKGKPDPRFPANLPNKPFAINDYLKPNDVIGDLVHRFYQNQQQIDGGAMDKFVQAGDAGAAPMGYFENKDSPLWQYAKNYTLADHFFVGIFGGSLVNHLFLICGCVPKYENAPKDIYAVLDDHGKLVHDGALTPDGYAVNTIQPRNSPYYPKVADPAQRLPAQTMPTIGDRLSEKGISWAWYAADWNHAVAGTLEPGFVFPYHHQPFSYFANYAAGTKGREHIKDENDLIAAIDNGTLPAVSFYKPSGKLDMHPGFAPLIESEEHTFELIHKIEKSPLWKHTLIIITFDDAGGFWDHVPPPVVDRFGPGSRIPTLVVSPLAKHGFVDHTVYDSSSILKLIETKYGLAPLGPRDAAAADMTNTLQ